MKQLLLNLVFFAVMRLLHATYRYRYFGTENRGEAEAIKAHGGFAIGLWHGNSMVGTLAHARQRFAPLCSLSPDGQMVAFLCRRIGLTPVCGSSSRGGKAAREALHDLIKRGISPAITVDGPKGPPYKSKPGIVSIAKDTGCAILPMIALPERFWRLKSWDKLKVPKPFSRVAVCYGPPIFVPADVTGESFEEYQARLDEELMALESEASQALGQWREKGGGPSRRWFDKPVPST